MDNKSIFREFRLTQKLQKNISQLLKRVFWMHAKKNMGKPFKTYRVCDFLSFLTCMLKKKWYHVMHRIAKNSNLIKERKKTSRDELSYRSSMIIPVLANSTRVIFFPFYNCRALMKSLWFAKKLAFVVLICQLRLFSLPQLVP